MNTLSLIDLAREFDDLRGRDENEQSLDDDDKEKLKELTVIEDELGDLYVYSKNNDDTLIDEDDFEEYIQSDMEDCYDLKSLPYIIKNNINWSNIADDMKSDYNEVSYEGTTYFIKAC